MKIAKAVALFVFLACMLWAGPKAEEELAKPIRPALLVIDIQNQYLPWVPEREREIGMEFINACIQQFRRHGFPIIRVYHTEPKWGPDPDSEEFQFPESVLIEESDPMIVKNYANAFNKTDLHKVLKKSDANVLFLCGMSSVGCVLATYFGAMDYDYKALMVEDAIMCHDSEYTDAVEEMFNTVNYAVLQMILEGAEH